MTEAAVKRAKEKKRNKLILIISSVLLVLSVIVWAVMFYNTNKNAYKQEVEYYEMGEFVEVGDDFFYVAEDNCNGYSVRVNKARLVDFKEYVEGNGGEVNPDSYSVDFPMPKYLVELDITVKNENNTDGHVDLRNFKLNRGSMSMSIDFQVLGLVEEFFTGYTGFMLVENSEADMKLVFTPQSLGLSQGLDFDGVNRALEEDDFNLSVTEWPVRKVIKVKIDKG